MYKASMFNRWRTRRLIGWLGLGLAGVLCVYAIFFAVVQISMRVARHRAERLLMQTRQLQVGKSTWVDFERLRDEWKGFGKADGDCSEKMCEYQIEISDFGGSSWRMAVLGLLAHSHDASASLQMQVENGIIVRFSYHFWTRVPKGYGPRWEAEAVRTSNMVPYSDYGYMLMARSASGYEESRRCCSWPEPAAHPGYRLSKPGGCEGCLAIWTSYMPNASAQEVKVATGFELDCITRWRPCVDEEDVMPESGARYYAENETRIELARKRDACFFSTEMLATAALNGAIVRGDDLPVTNAGYEVSGKARLVRMLGGKFSWTPRASQGIDLSLLSQLALDRYTKAVKEHQPVILLFEKGYEGKPTVDPCGVLPASSATVTTVMNGIAQGKGFSFNE